VRAVAGFYGASFRRDREGPDSDRCISTLTAASAPAAGRPRRREGRCRWRRELAGPAGFVGSAGEEERGDEVVAVFVEAEEAEEGAWGCREAEDRLRELGLEAEPGGSAGLVEGDEDEGAERHSGGVVEEARHLLGPVEGNEDGILVECILDDLGVGRTVSGPMNRVAGGLQSGGQDARDVNVEEESSHGDWREPASGP